MKHIPIHKLNDRASIGLEIRHTSSDKLKKAGHILGAHRDDHYLFFMMESGTITMMIDFNQIIIEAPSICYILPGQVHHSVADDHAEGWFMAVDTSLVPNEYRAIFEYSLSPPHPHRLNAERYQQCHTLIRLLFEQFSSKADGAFYSQLTHSLLSSFLGMAACGFIQPENTHQQTSRPWQIIHQFKQLLTENMLTIKQPAAYAALLNISESYLNETLKKTTGSSVTYLITNAVILEAKRLLYYSGLSVKEIAHELGYEDHTYFSRLFKKVTEMTPLEFKAIYRK